MYLAVYGTLKAGFHNHGVLGRNAKYLGSCWVENYALLDEGFYPAAFRFPGRQIWVEVYEIDEATLKATDRLEGANSVPPYYTREEVKTPYGPAFMYARCDRPMTALTKWFPDGIWYGTPSYHVYWLGWNEEIRLCKLEHDDKDARRLLKQDGAGPSIYIPPERTTGKMVKVWDVESDSWEYVTEAQAVGMPRERPPSPPTNMEKARAMISDAVKEAPIPEERVA